MATGEYVELNENTSAPIFYLTEDIDGDDLSIWTVSEPLYGSIDSNVYTPDAGFSGSDLYVYKAYDGNLYSNQTTITFDVIDVNDPPIALDQNQVVDEDLSITFDLLGSDPEDDLLSFTLDVLPENGTVELNGIQVLYTPNENYEGSDSFTFSANDGELTSLQSGSINISIIGINDAPTSSDFSIIDDDGDGNVSIDFSDFINDIDSELTSSSIGTIPPSIGENLVTVFGNEFIYSGSGFEYSYDITNDFDMVLYKVTDEQAESYVATAIYDNRPSQMRAYPLALNNDINMEEDNVIQIEFYGTDLDNFTSLESVSKSITAAPQNGILGDFTGPFIVDDAASTVKWIADYTPTQNFSGSDVITFSVIDDEGLGSFADGTVSITINAVNDLSLIHI